MNINIFVALNKITIVATNKLILKKIHSIVLYHGERCDHNEINSALLKFPLNFITEFILFILLKLFGRKINLHLPHLKVGTRISQIVNTGYPISLIPDGMDYYREIPNNINIKNERLNIKEIYLDNFHPFIPAWILRYPELVNLNIDWCKNSNSESNKFKAGDHVIIESPGVEEVFNNSYHLPCNVGRIYIIRHPALGKRKKIPLLKNIEVIECSLKNLENTLLDSCGVNLYFGETFTLVMMLNTDFYTKNNINIFLSREKKTIINPLISLLNETNAKIVYY